MKAAMKEFLSGWAASRVPLQYEMLMLPPVREARRRGTELSLGGGNENG